MNNINYIQIVMSMMFSVMILMSSVINSFERYMPVFLRQTIRYGKFSCEKKSVFSIEVPKSWFKHFYVYSSVLTVSALYFCIKVYLCGSAAPSWILDVLDATAGSYREPSVNATRILLAMTLLTLQCLRRAYDTQFVSVFGKNSRMNLAHYVVGYVHYTCCVLCILAEAPNFSKSHNIHIILNWTDINFVDLFAGYFFVWSWFHQYRVTVVLANLRKNDKGEVASDEYKLPHGDWFDYISSPHNLAEISMYTALTLILWSNVTWWFIFFWVLSNQVETALMTHWWYQEKFHNLPKHRRALLPYIL